MVDDKQKNTANYFIAVFFYSIKDLSPFSGVSVYFFIIYGVKLRYPSLKSEPNPENFTSIQLTVSRLSKSHKRFYQPFEHPQPAFEDW